jgi:capsular polysaccharide biosynthesis protein
MFYFVESCYWIKSERSHAAFDPAYVWGDSMSDKIEVLLKQEEKETGFQEEEISLAEILRIIINGKWLIGALFFIGVIACFIYFKFLAPEIGNIQTIISYNYEGIEKGLDPYGKNMDVSMIKSPIVLDQVVHALELNEIGLSSDDLRKNIDISPIIPGNVTQNIKRLEENISSNIDSLQAYIYYPNKYIINFRVGRKLNISTALAQQILDEVIRQYQQYFYRTYSDMSVLANAIQPLDYEEYDYPEISTVIHNQLDIFTNYVRTKMNQEYGSNFRSVETGMSFGDIMESISIIKKVDLSRLDSIIGAYNLTKNKEKLIKLYEYRIKQAELSMDQKNEESALLTDIIQKYQKDQNLVIASAMAAGTDGTGFLNVERTDEYYNTLTQQFVDAGIAAKQSQIMILHYQQEIEKLLNDTVDAASKASAEADVRLYIQDIKARMEYWIDITNRTVAEYYETNLFNQAITRNSPSEFISILGESKMTFAIAAAIALMLGVCIVFIRHYLKKQYSAEP